MDDVAVAILHPLDELAVLEEVQALVEVRDVALQRRRERHAPVHQELGQRARRRCEVAIANGGFRRRQQDRRRHRRSARDRHVVHLAQDAEPEFLNEVPFLVFDRRVGDRLLETPTLVSEGGIERDRLRERHVDGAVLLAQHAPRLQKRAEGFLLLLSTEQLLLVRLLFDDATVVDRDRYEVEVAADAVDEDVDDGRQHSELRGQDLSRPAPPALDEELLRVPLADQILEILPEDRLVERIAFERPTDEVRTRAAEERPERPERHVDARRDVGRRKRVLVEDVGQYQIVEVASVTWHQHDGVLLDRFDDALETAHLEPTEHAIPGAMEEERQDGEVVAVEVRGDLVEVAARLLRHFLDRDVALRCDRPHDLLHVVGVEHHLAYLTLRPEGGPPYQPLLAVEKDLQRPRESAYDPIVALVAILGHERIQRNLGPDRDAEIARVPRVGHELLHVARRFVHAVDEAGEP